MKYVKHEFSAGYCGTDETRYLRFPDDVARDSYGYEEDSNIEEELDSAVSFINEEDIEDGYVWEDA